MCKHALACKLADALEKIKEREVEDEDFAPLLLGSRNHLRKFDDRKPPQGVATF